MNSQKITIEAVIAAPPEKVWQYWTEPHHITKWNFATEEWCCPEAENDLRIGGVYRARMEARDGSFGFDFEAIYSEINECQKIAYTLTDGRTVTTDFIQQNQSTKVTTVFEADSENPIDMQRDGWQAILNNFKKYTENH